MIEIRYRSDGAQMARAAILYVQYHLSSFSWKAVTLSAGIGTLAAIPYYWMSRDLNAYWALIHLCSIVFIFGRHKIYRALIRKNMRRHPIHDIPIHIVLTSEHLKYSSDSHHLHDDEAPWEKVPMILQAENGYVIVAPCSRFVWLPFSATDGPEQLAAIEQFFSEKNIRIEPHPEWTC